MLLCMYVIQTSIFRYSKNYGSLTHETRKKDAVNMGDLICLLATVRTLKFPWLTPPSHFYLQMSGYAIANPSTPPPLIDTKHGNEHIFMKKKRNPLTNL